MNVWLVDDNLPVNKCVDARTRRGLTPVEREALSRLVNEDAEAWKKDVSLQELCKKLLADDSCYLLGFQNPGVAAAHIDQTSARPDVVVFDWDFHGDANSPKMLAQLFQQSFFVAVIYSQTDSKEIWRRIDSSKELEPYRPLIMDVHLKGKVDAATLLRNLDTKLKLNFAWKFASKIRSLSASSIDLALSELGTLDLEKALQVLGQDTSKIDSQFLAQAFSSRLVSALQVGELELEDKLQQLLEERKKVKAATPRGAEYEYAARRFIHFQMYSRPTDNYARQGDVVRRVKDEAAIDGDDLWLILNAACDLERCTRKTRDFLTLLRVRPLDQRSTWEILERGGNKFKKMKSNILDYEKSSGGAIFLPNLVETVANGSPTYRDYVGVAQELGSMRLKPSDVGAKDRRKYNTLELEDGTSFIPVCNIAMEFLPAITSHISEAITGKGVPDIPPFEQARIKALYDKTTGEAKASGKEKAAKKKN